MFFILFAIIGILFFVASTNNRIATIENIFRQLWPSGWIRMFSENEGEGEGGRNQLLGSTTSVRFTRNKPSEHSQGRS
uniref:Secreted protein n=1 Tax=Meloidogyne hapla TaxID=6305 RepID=A0A1I8B7G1_MELHA